MKLPNQAQPISRKINSIRTPEHSNKYVEMSADCNADCAWMTVGCAPALLGGVGAYAACLAASAVANPNCRPCVEWFAKEAIKYEYQCGTPGNPPCR